MRFVAASLAAIVLAPGVHATILRIWSIDELAKAPLLAVATVESAIEGEAAPEKPHRFYEATLRIRRSYAQGAVAEGPRIQIRYISYGDRGRGGVNGPSLPSFEAGQTALFALAPGAGGFWRLAADEGVNLTVPAIVTEWREAGAPANGRAFILSELANALANGDTRSRHDAARYLREPGAWPDRFREVAERAIGEDDDRWLEVGCALLASLGLGHPTVDEMLAGGEVRGAANQGAAWALKRGARREFPDRLVRRLLRNMPAYDWGAANALLEFKDSPLVVNGMKTALAHDAAGSIYVAWVLARNGQHSFLPEALAAAVKLVGAPEAVGMSRLQASSWLLRDYGSDAQFDVIPATLRRLQTINENAYRKVFGAINYMESPRELRVAAVLIDDRRMGLGTIRYCDAAAATIQKLSGQSFGMKFDGTAEDRDRAVTRAKAWLRTQRM